MTQAVALAQLANNTSNFRNKIINGDMRISQQANGASVATNTVNWTAYAVDRFNASFRPSTGVAAVQRVTDVPAGAGFINSLKLTQSSVSSAAASDIYQIYHRIEGFNINDLAWGTASARPLTVSFWVKASIAGTYSLGFTSGYDGSTYRSFIYDYTISSTGTWERKTITIPGDTGGTSTWSTVTNTNGIGLSIYWDLGSGSDYQTSAGSWVSGNFSSSSSRTRLMGTSGATFQLTGVQAEVGTQATNFENRPYGTELQLCQRYCEILVAKGTNGGLWPAQYGSTSSARGVYSFKVQKRTAPSFTNLGGTNYLIQNGSSGNVAPTSVNMAAANPSGALIDCTCGAVGTAGHAAMILEGSLSDGQPIIVFNAEL